MSSAVRRMVRAAAALFNARGHDARRDEGFTIIEVVMASAILLTVMTAVMSTVSYATTGSMQAQKRQGALNLATYYVEYSHALPYSSVGTTNGAALTGSPAGTIPSVVATSGYTVTNTVRYAIDPQTHMSSYKIVHVDVTWTIPKPGKVSVESAVMGGETLTGAQVLISAVDLDDASVEVPGVLITLDPNGTTTNQQVTTDSNGQALFGSVATGACVVAATRALYMADLKPFVGKSVNSGLNEWTMSLQRASSATIHTQLADGTDISGCSVSLTCTDTSHIASFTTTKTTDVGGDALYPNLWEIKNSGYSYLAKCVVPGYVNGSTLTTNFPMESGGLDKTINFVIPATTWLDVYVVDQAAGWGVDTAVVSYTNPDGSAGSKTATTDVNGHAYFFGLTPGLRYTFTANKTYSTAPTLRTGSQGKTIASGYNYVLVQTNRN